MQIFFDLVLCRDEIIFRPFQEASQVAICLCNNMFKEDKEKGRLPM